MYKLRFKRYDPPCKGASPELIKEAIIQANKMELRDMMNEQTTQVCLRCKILTNELYRDGVTVEDIRREFAKEVRKKVIPKSYNSIGHLSGSRLGESDSHVDAKQEEHMTVKFPPIPCKLYIEEKMDGSNVAVVKKNGELIAIGRSGYRCDESDLEQHKRFAVWVEKHKDMFAQVLFADGDRVVGEWMVQAHGTIYSDLLSPFYAFELYYHGVQLNNDEKRLELYRAGFAVPPCLYSSAEKPLPINEALALLENSPHAEGVVYRLERFDKKQDRYVPWTIAKVVKQDKVDGLYLKQDTPVWLFDENYNPIGKDSV